MIMWSQKLEGSPEWAFPYFLQLKTNAIQLFPATLIGTKSALRLYERTGIVASAGNTIVVYSSAIDVNAICWGFEEST